MLAFTKMARPMLWDAVPGAIFRDRSDMRDVDGLGPAEKERRRVGHTPGRIGLDRRVSGPSLLLRPLAGFKPVLDAAESARLGAALDEASSPAFVIWADGQVALANAGGWAELDRVPEFVASRLRASLDGHDDAYRVTRILSSDAPSHFMAVQHR
jgi:hypothetical protein